jgi:hypothetical protein
VVERVFFDMEGSATDTDGIRLGDGTIVAKQCVVKDCVFHGCDNVAIEVSDNSIDNKIIGNIVEDGIQFATATCTNGVLTAGERTYIADNEIKCGLTSGACISMAATALQTRIHNNKLWAYGANTIGILYAALATGSGANNFVNAVAAGNLVDFTTSATSPSAHTDWGNVTNVDPAAPALITATVGGS